MKHPKRNTPGSLKAIAAALAVISTCASAMSCMAEEAADTVEISVTPGNNMPIVRGEIDGVACSLLFDTGATHTTFNRAFLEKNFPEMEFESVMLGGISNVKQSPSLAIAKSLKIGRREFKDCPVMVLDISHISASSGRQIDGVLGMNIIGLTRTVVSLHDGKVIFNAPESAREGFSPVPRIHLEDPLTITLQCKMPDAQLIIDSASSFTFFPQNAGWAAASSNAVAIAAADVNASGHALNSVEGEHGEMTFQHSEAKIPVRPLLSPSPLNRIGADTLKNCDILIEHGNVGFKVAGEGKRETDGDK